MAKKISNIAETSVKKDPQAAMLLRMFDRMSKRSNWDSMWDEVARYIAPDKNYAVEKKIAIESGMNRLNNTPKIPNGPTIDPFAACLKSNRFRF